MKQDARRRKKGRKGRIFDESMEREIARIEKKIERKITCAYSIRCSKKRAIETGCIEVSYCKDFIRPAVLGGYNLSYQCKRDSR